MKKASSLLLVVGSLFVLNIQRPPVADVATITVAQEVSTEKGKAFKVNADQSSVGWVGTKPTGQHTGILKVTDGMINARKNKLLSGMFTLDMASINCKDLEGKSKDGLEGHLKSPDFFDVAKYPTATFKVSSIKPIAANQNVVLEGATHNISGNLTMKGMTKNVTFPAVIKVEDKMLSATADFNIDRTEWGITYGADGKVAKEINLKLNIVANQ
jgi:polyisoprenoid-binding protein YceI